LFNFNSAPFALFRGEGFSHVNGLRIFFVLRAYFWHESATSDGLLLNRQWIE
jgi:hypothetical protein